VVEYRALGAACELPSSRVDNKINADEKYILTILSAKQEIEKQRSEDTSKKREPGWVYWIYAAEEFELCDDEAHLSR
jgi:hypothetical protein